MAARAAERVDTRGSRGGAGGGGAMSALVTKILSDIRRRRTQTAVILIIVVLASCVATMALTLFQEAGGPFDRAFAQQRGAHLVALFDATRTSPAGLRATQRRPGVTAFGGPW